MEWQLMIDSGKYMYQSFYNNLLYDKGKTNAKETWKLIANKNFKINTEMQVWIKQMNKRGEKYIH